MAAGVQVRCQCQMWKLLFLLQLAIGAWQDGHKNFARVGSQLSVHNVSSSLECYNLCKSEKLCSAWNLNIVRSTCELLSGKTQGFEVSGIVSGTQATTLAPKAYTPLRLGSVTPTGWLVKQLQLQADGLTGHLSLFWNDIENSMWIGGTGDTGLHERVPYWLNGILPLSYLLQNVQEDTPVADPICQEGVDMPYSDITSGNVASAQACYDWCANTTGCVAFIVNDCDSSNIYCWLKYAITATQPQSCRCYGVMPTPPIPSVMDQSWKYINYILAHQAPSGWLGPDDAPTDGNQYWGPMDVLQTFTQAAEANSTMFTPLTQSLLRYFQEADRRMRNVVPLQGWAAQRYQDMILSIHWLLENAPQDQEQFLWDLAELCYDQGVDWEQWFATWTGDAGNHGVNNAQGLKSSAVVWRQSQDPSLVQSSQQRMVNMDQTYGLPSGMFCADELLCEDDERQMPSRGTELCAVVEAMFSYETMFGIHGFVQFADRVEKIAYNAMPATWASPLGGDMWNHQYLQAVNQIMAVHSDPHVWTNDGPDAEIYGLEPNYGCCTANHPQGWPKLAQNLIYTTQDQGVAVGIFAPVSAILPNKMGSISVITDYPFDDVITITMNNAIAPMPLYVRIPIWATNATLSVNSGADITPPNGTMYKIVLSSAGTTKVYLKLNPSLSLQTGWNGAVSVHREPFMYSFPIEGFFDLLNTYAYDSRDYEVIPLESWNFALQLDPNKLAQDLMYKQAGYVAGSAPFNATGPYFPNTVQATVRLVSTWGTALGSAAPPPLSPACGGNPDPCGPAIQVQLVPYGLTSLRISEMPLAGASSPEMATPIRSAEDVSRLKEIWRQVRLGGQCQNEKMNQKPFSSD